MTVRGLDPLGHAGSIVTHPLPLALAAWGCGAPYGLAVVLGALAARLLLALRIDRIADRRSAPLMLLPLRDMIGFGVFLSSLVTRRVEWRGSRLAVALGDRIADTRP